MLFHLFPETLLFDRAISLSTSGQGVLHAYRDWLVTPSFEKFPLEVSIFETIWF